MLRLQNYQYHRPTELSAALDILGSTESAMPIAGGTDLMPNMKHKLWTPDHLVALKGITQMRGIHWVDADLVPTGDAGDAVWLAIGAGETLDRISRDPHVLQLVPALARAAGLVAGPQIRNQGTIGGNLCLDTRCTYYNQTEFWRNALGYCLKKDGDVCHVTRVGKKCVAANSADTPPVLMSVGAEVDLASPRDRRTVPVADFFIADGMWNTVRDPDELVVRVRIPVAARNLRTAYQKVRQRNSIDFPLLSIAVAADLEDDQSLRSMSIIVSALGSRPRVVSGLEKIVEGKRLEEVVDDVAMQTHKQSHPLENIIVDPEWRRAMVPIYVRRALAELV